MQEYLGQELGDNLEEKLELSGGESEAKVPTQKYGWGLYPGCGVQVAVPGWRQGGRGHPQPGPR